MHAPRTATFKLGVLCTHATQTMPATLFAGTLGHMRWLTVTVISLLAALPSAALSAAQDVPLPPQVEFIDGADVLSSSDQELLATEVTQAGLPNTVSHVAFLTFANNDDNLNDTVLDFGKSQRPDLLNESQNKYAPGLLLLSIGLGPNRMGVYCGDDVCADIDMYADGRLDGILDQMEPGMKGGNYAVGFTEGVRAAADTAVRRDTSSSGSSEPTNWPLVGVAIAGLGALFAGGIGLTIVGARRKKVATLRERMDYVKAHHADVGLRLQEIDVRANSLTSALANDSLRLEWGRVKESFNRSHDAVARYDDASDKHLLARESAINKAYDSIQSAQRAQESIDTLFALEHGDAEVRRRELSTLHDDVRAAELEAGDLDTKGNLHTELVLLGERIAALRSKSATTPTGEFMDEYTQILRDYGILTEHLKTALYATTDAPEQPHKAPRLGDADWSPGIGHYYVPYALINQWHTTDVSAHNAVDPSTGSSATTSYSTPGFSGGGGSRGF